MDITSPNNLWKEYDVTALPFNSSPLSEKSENGVTIKELYFDGYTTVDGRVRTFLRIMENPQAKGIVLYLSDTNGGYDDSALEMLFGMGYTVAFLDYLGKSDKYARFTLYPRSLASCNQRGCKNFDISEEEQYSPWYIWTCISRRAIGFLAQQYRGTKMFALGVGLGGCTVYKLSAFNDGLSACATLLNIIPDVSGSGNSIINYHASLENSAYAPFCTVPLFMAVSSNDEDGSLDEMSALAEETASLRRFRIVQRALSCGITSVYPEVDRFFCYDYCMNVAPRPKITASNSEGNLYFNIVIENENTDNENIDAEASEKSPFAPELYVSFCIEDPPYRNWMAINTISLGNGVFIAPINVCQDKLPVDAFVNLTDAQGNVQSSRLLTVIPKTLGIKAREGVAHRKIYDGSMGKDGWTSRNGGEIKIVKGPFDIDGATSTTNSLLSFKLGDALFKVPSDTLLQVMICGSPQKITVSVKDKDNSYSCDVEITSSEDWFKFSLSHLNFKSAAGPLFDWSQVVMLEFSSDKNFIIGSVLWV